MNIHKKYVHVQYREYILPVETFVNLPQESFHEIIKVHSLPCFLANHSIAIAFQCATPTFNYFNIANLCKMQNSHNLLPMKYTPNIASTGWKYM